MSRIKKIKLYSNDREYSKKIEEELTIKLERLGYVISDEDCDLCIAIGGDGTFLKMVRSCGFNESVYYLGVNTGTLGFAQEIYPNGIDAFLERLVVDNYKIHDIGIQETNIYNNDEVNKYYSLNEIVIREANLNTAHLNILINDNVLETFAGDGLLISTSFGSTAYNLSFGGSIIYNDLHTLQITPIAPLNNKNYRNLLNSVVIPEDRIVNIIPGSRSRDLLFSIDGDNVIYHDIDKVDTTIKRKIKCMRMSDYDYTKKINEKLVRDI